MFNIYWIVCLTISCRMDGSVSDVGRANSETISTGGEIKSTEKVPEEDLVTTVSSVSSTTAVEDSTSDIDDKTATSHSQPDLETRTDNSNTGYTKRQYIILISTLIGQFFTNGVASLPAPFLPKLVSYLPVFC